MKPSHPSNKRRLVVSIADHGSHLVTRSQAKQIVVMIDNCDELELDFTGVESTGQGFADELLRVWPLEHTKIQMIVTGATSAVQRMAEHIRSRTDLPQPGNIILRQE